MAARTTTSTRWVTGILVVALLASVLVVVGLIQITGGTSSSSTASESPTPDSASPSPSAGPPTTAASSTIPEGRATGTAATTTPVELAGSGLILPAAWTGTADMTITVNGRCASIGGTSFYTRPAQFALQVSPPPANTGTATSGSAGSGVASPSGSAPAGPSPIPTTSVLPPPGPVSMTLGITPTDLPGLSIYSTSSGRDGSIRRTWTVDATADPADPNRTLISATLVDDQPLGGALPPNLLVDSETDLQPCETDSGVRLPRPLAKGSTVTGWVSATEASLQVNAGTTDGERTVQADLRLTRPPGS
ncbi:MAG TPA: hypothetical protein VIU11_10265 [Nakamurella sp.]